MAGLYVPLVMIPRFTSYVGEGEYTTAPLDVTEFAGFNLTIWRGPLVGNLGSATGAGLSLVFQQSDDAEAWTDLLGISPITTASASSIIAFGLTGRWFRAKLTLTADSTDIVALTLWAMGNLERRERS